MSARPSVAIVGAGPAGLFAAEILAERGCAVTVYDRMPSPARKFLMAGRGGLNLTHSEDLERFTVRYHGGAGSAVQDSVRTFPPQDLVAWANRLGIETFTGSSGRIFPRTMKASPLLRAWLRRLSDLGVDFRMRWTWVGFGKAPRTLLFETPGGPATVSAGAVLLTLGGGSWPKLGSDGSWVHILRDAGVPVSDLAAANCGVKISWSDAMLRHHGAPLKRIALTCGEVRVRGEAVITRAGLEGGCIYAAAAAIRAALAAAPSTSIEIDLKPDMSSADLTERLAKAAAKDSLSNVLRKSAGLSPAAATLVREGATALHDAQARAAAIKNVRLTVTGLSGLDRAISTAGGVCANGIDGSLMLTALPGVYVAGEMLDFDAPTGGYLLQAAFSTAHRAAGAIAKTVERQPQPE